MTRMSASAWRKTVGEIVRLSEAPRPARFREYLEGLPHERLVARLAALREERARPAEWSGREARRRRERRTSGLLRDQKKAQAAGKGVVEADRVGAVAGECRVGKGIVAPAAMDKYVSQADSAALQGDGGADEGVCADGDGVQERASTVQKMRRGDDRRAPSEREAGSVAERYAVFRASMPAVPRVDWYAPSRGKE